MRNKLSIFFLSIFFLYSNNLSSQEIEVNSSKISFDAENQVTIFEGNVNAKDDKQNTFFSEIATYNKKLDFFQTNGETKIITSNGYKVSTANIEFDNKKKIINSKFKTEIIDIDGNKINLDNFSYSAKTNIFFSKGNIKIIDINQNIYNFSEIYIDETKQTVIGSDVKAFLNKNDFAINNENDPRFFANTIYLSNKINSMDKGIFTYCKDKGDDSCPPWTLQSNKIKHDLEKKTIYYDNVVLKIYDFPIFYSPKFSHPDPTVDRRSGLLAPSLSNSSTLGSGLKLPYFWNISNDRDLTITPKFYLKENPLILAEYRQDFKNSFLILDTSYTQGFKKKDNKKSDGGRNHFFSKFNLNFFDDSEKSSDLEINLQKVNNDTYFKVHDINTELVQKDQNILANTLSYTYQNKDFFLGVTPSFYEDTTKFGNLRNEYLLPLSIEKNLFTSEKLGFLDLTSNLNLRNYETNKQANFFINDLNWKSNSWLNKFGFESYFNALVKTVNYETKKTTEYKNSKLNSELNSVFGYNAKLNLFKKNNENSKLYSLTPKFLLRYAPGHMRNIEGGRLNYDNLYQLNKVDESDVIENGLSSSIGLEFKQNKINNNNIEEEQLSFSIGQVISQKENMDIPSSTSLDQKLSDVVGKANYNINDKVKLNYNFSLDHNYKELNYNEIAAEYNLESVKFNLSYLQEKNHIGNQDLISAGINYKLNNFSELDFSSKRNLITNSAEFYNLSYNYFNDCLKAGITYRREFYTDRDVEPENRLMFTISIIPFAEINSPSISR